MWGIIVLLVVGLFQLFQKPDQKMVADKVPFSQFLKNVEDGRVVEVVIKGNDIEGMLSELPDDIGQLQKLQFISIPNNPNLIHIPEVIADLPSLEVLNVKNNAKMVIPHKIMEKAACGELVLIKTQPDKSFGVGECSNGQKIVVNYVDDQGDYQTREGAADAII